LCPLPLVLSLGTTGKSFSHSAWAAEVSLTVRPEPWLGPACLCTSVFRELPGFPRQNLAPRYHSEGYVTAREGFSPALPGVPHSGSPQQRGMLG